MPGLIVNTQEAMDSRSPLEPGEYHVTLTKATLKDASGPDKYPMIVMEFTVAEDEGEYAGRPAFRNLSASPKALPYMVDAALALQADPEEVVQPSVDMEQIFLGLIGNECWIVTSIREYQRNENEPAIPQTNVDRILAAPSGG